MAFTHNTPLLAALCILLSFFSSALAQTPSNASFPDRIRYYSLRTTSDGMSNRSPLLALTDSAKLGARQSLDGTLVLATPSTASSLQPRAIVCISCDPETYEGQNIDAAKTLSLVLGGRPEAIVVISNTSTHCDYTGDQTPAIYSMTNVNFSQALLTELEMGSGQAGPASIRSAPNGDSNGPNGGSTSTDSGSYDGHTPTTAVAMIILYSITGIITALFLIIIVVGAVRAHRHPERYGPRNVLGRPRQSRARGIARAMLETIPIVKFGEREEDKPGQQRTGGDVELGQTQRETRAAEEPPAVEVHPPSIEQHAPQNTTIKDSTEPEAVTTEKADGPAVATEGRTSIEVNADNGLACSVCTDDFTKGQDVRVLPCNHKFHPECIDPWLLNVSGTCPLCRVDLRPTASHPHDPEDPTESGDLSHLDEAGASTENVDDTTRRERRRSRTGLSLYLQHTLNRRRMRDATPEERVAALRRLRTVNNESDSDNTRNRLSARLSRAFHHDSRRGSTLNPENDRSRRGSALTPDARSVNNGSRPVSAVIPENRRGSFAG